MSAPLLIWYRYLWHTLFGHPTNTTGALPHSDGLYIYCGKCGGAIGNRIR